MRLKLDQLRVEGHAYKQRDISDFAEKILAGGYQQIPISVRRKQYGKHIITNGVLRFLALSYIAQYSACKVILDGIECYIPQEM